MSVICRLGNIQKNHTRLNYILTPHTLYLSFLHHFQKTESNRNPNMAKNKKTRPNGFGCLALWVKGQVGLPIDGSTLALSNRHTHTCCLWHVPVFLGLLQLDGLKKKNHQQGWFFLSRQSEQRSPQHLLLLQVISHLSLSPSTSMYQLQLSGHAVFLVSRKTLQNRLMWIMNSSTKIYNNNF